MSKIGLLPLLASSKHNLIDLISKACATTISPSFVENNKTTFQQNNKATN
jgi:hypothetical protein